MRKLSALVVDDEPIMCAALRQQLDKFPFIEVIAECQDGSDALEAAERLKPDIVFLDIRMPGLSGIDVAAALDQMDLAPEVVFVTAYDDYALKAYEVSAVDYILKPFDREDIIRVLRRIRRFRSLQAIPLLQETSTTLEQNMFPTKFCLYANEQMEIVDVNSIKMFVVERGDVFAHTSDEVRFFVKQSLQEIEQKLDYRKFFRCHRNFIVNMDYVKTVSPWFNRGLLLTLKGGKGIEVPVSRAHTKKLEKYIHF